MINLDELQKLAEAGTKGEWFRKEGDIFVLFQPSLMKYKIAEVSDQCNEMHIAAFNPTTCLELIAKLRKAEEALEFYAPKRLYVNVGLQNDIYDDQGKRARECLSELRGLGGGG